ncbi:chorismate mutase [Clostridium thermobutyricum]|uniref:Bifunctional chorismate mutase/prephenate dehydratase n=1 Tax=Clostridium thermobutyricum TaxID=29372 RepID=N9WIC0_9CLOT|nr:prephenate dehydratase [Clostridium thermobutyricum]ENZ02645.1 chorismate mutase [Clostridium thermobutyricum]
MNSLDSYRKEIDSIDEKITELFEKRMDVVLKVANYKKENNLPIFHKGREELVIKKNVDRLKNKDYSKELEKFFNEMMGVSRELQGRKLNRKSEIDSIKERKITKESKIGFQGVRGSFTEEALLKYFSEENESIAYEEFEDVFKAIDRGEVDYGILPVENSSTGGISEVHDLLAKYGFHIAGEISIKIEQHLMGLEGATLESIDEVYSHNQGFAQCAKFLKEYDHLKLIPFHNTATSAKLVSDLKDDRKAAIGSRRAAEIYGLKILRSNINDEKDNHTRFIIVSKELLKEDGANKISVVFSLEDKPGSLSRLLKIFSENNLNMIRIESRPTKNRNWKYYLYVDFEGSLENIEVSKALKTIKDSSEYFNILGWYKNGL